MCVFVYECIYKYMCILYMYIIHMYIMYILCTMYIIYVYIKRERVCFATSFEN